MLAVPPRILAPSQLSRGQQATPAARIGPSVVREVLLQTSAEPETADAASPVEVLLVDLSDVMLGNLAAPDGGEDESLLRFADDLRLPHIGELLRVAWEWVGQPAASERLQYYSAEEDAAANGASDSAEEDEADLATGGAGAAELVVGLS